MSTTDTVLLIILDVLVGLFFLLCSIAVLYVIKLLKSVQRVALKAESVVDSVESAADVLKGASGKLAVIKLIKNIVDTVQHKK
jgi:hypothetical protein